MEVLFLIILPQRSTLQKLILTKNCFIINFVVLHVSLLIIINYHHHYHHHHHHH